MIEIKWYIRELEIESRKFSVSCSSWWYTAYGVLVGIMF